MTKRTINIDDDLYGIINWAVTGAVIIMFMVLIGFGLHRAGIV